MAPRGHGALGHWHGACDATAGATAKQPKLGHGPGPSEPTSAPQPNGPRLAFSVDLSPARPGLYTRTGDSEATALGVERREFEGSVKGSWEVRVRRKADLEWGHLEDACSRRKVRPTLTMTGCICLARVQHSGQKPDHTAISLRSRYTKRNIALAVSSNLNRGESNQTKLAKAASIELPACKSSGAPVPAPNQFIGTDRYNCFSQYGFELIPFDPPTPRPQPQAHPHPCVVSDSSWLSPDPMMWL